MPILTLPCTPFGPIVDLAISVSAARAKVMNLRQPPIPIPPAIHLRALIDTGADLTCVSPGLLKALDMTPTGSITLGTASTPQQCDQYDVCLTLLHPALNAAFDNRPIAECAMTHHASQARLGRDILAECLFVYDGEGNRFILSF